MRESLIDSVLSVMAGKDVEVPEVADTIPELGPEHSGTVALGKPQEAEKRVRARLGELRKQDLAELKAKVADVEAQIKAEKEIAEAGDFNLKAELAAGTSRDELASKRAAADIANEAIYIHQDVLDDLQDQIEKVSRACLMRDQRVMATIKGIRTSYMVYLQAFCGGDATVYKLNNERVERAYNGLIQATNILKAQLDDDDLVHDVLAEVTTYETPASYQHLLWHFMSDRYKERFEGAEPDELMKLFNTKSDNNSKESK